MRKIVIRFITFLGLAFFFTVIIPFLSPESRSAAYAGDLDTVVTPIPEPTPTEESSDSELIAPPEELKPEIKLNVKTKSLVKETSYALKVYNATDNQKVTFKSNDPSIASVNEKGLVTANAVGSTLIVVTVKDSAKTITLQCKIIVGPPAVSLKLTRSEITLPVGRKTTLKAILQPNNTVEDVKFCSYDPSIAAVSPEGRIVAKEVGITYIYAGINNGKYDLCKVTVVEEVPEESDSYFESEVPVEVITPTDPIAIPETDFIK